MKIPLRYITFEITQDCNLSCLYCYNHWRRERNSIQQTTFRQANRTLDRILKMVDFEHIAFTGGEPFLADGLKELVLKCRMNGKGVTIISNGTAAKTGDYQMLIDLGVSLFEFPLHADNPAVHDEMTGKPGSFGKVMDSINTLKKARTEICTVCVLTKLNIDGLKNTLEFAGKLGIKRFMLARFNIGGRGIKNADRLLPSLSQLLLAFQIANDFAQAGGLKISANVCVPLCIINPKDFPNIPISSCGADITRKPVTFDAEGNVRMCNHSPVTLGNIHSESMEAILASDTAKAWEENCPDLCADCAEWKICRGGCRAASEQIGKSLHDEDPAIRLLAGNIITNCTEAAGVSSD